MPSTICDRRNAKAEQKQVIFMPLAASQSIFRQSEHGQFFYPPLRVPEATEERQNPMYVHLTKPEKRKLGKKLLLP